MLEGQSSGLKDPSLYHLPPQSIDAEEAILSAILLDNSSLLDVVEILSPDDFYKLAHQKAFAAIKDLFDKSEPVDLVTLANRLREKGQIEEVGGAAYLARIVDSAPMAVNAQHYAKIVHEKALLRRLIEKANAIARRCYEDRGSAEETVDFAENAVFSVSEKRYRQSFYLIAELIDKSIDALEERQGNKALFTGVPTGFSQFDEKTSGLQKSDLIIIAARPSMGKTAFALNIARNVAVEADVPCALFSLEMSKEQIAMRLLCAESRVDSHRMRSGFMSQEDWIKFTNAAGVLEKAPIYIDDTPGISALEIRAKARKLKMEVNLGLIIIDYIQLMRSHYTAERRDLEISEISRSLKALAKELDLPVIAISQLNRKLEDRADKRPQLSDLRESGALEQDADVVAFIYRDELYNKDENNPNKGKAEILLSKQRNGPTGIISLTFLTAFTRFENPATVDTE